MGVIYGIVGIPKDLSGRENLKFQDTASIKRTKFRKLIDVVYNVYN